MSQFRIFMASKKDITIAVTGNVTNNTVVANKYTYASEQQGMPGVRENALHSLVEAMKAFDIKQATSPVQIYVVDSLASMITNETYKYWLMSGKKNDGTEVHASELALWKEFHKLMSKNSMYFIIKTLNDANYNGKPKFNQANIAYNKYYYDWVWAQVHKVYPKGPAEPVMNEPEVV